MISNLEHVTGIPDSESRKIFEEVKANSNALKSCEKHDFKLIENPNPFRRKWKCDKCGGVIDNLAHHWYERGVADGKKA